VGAIEDATRAIAIEPKDASAFNVRGAAYAATDKFNEAIADLNKAIELNPSLPNPYKHRGVAYLKAGNYALARADIEKALALNLVMTTPNRPSPSLRLPKPKPSNARITPALSPPGTRRFSSTSSFRRGTCFNP
jgi:Flp pilus assembly protein TadD